MRWLKIAAGVLLQKLRERSYPPPELLKAGMMAPDLELSDDTGNKHSLKNYAGKKVVLWFYIRARTPG